MNLHILAKFSVMILFVKGLLIFICEPCNSKILRNIKYILMCRSRKMPPVQTANKNLHFFYNFHAVTFVNKYCKLVYQLKFRDDHNISAVLDRFAGFASSDQSMHL